MKDKVFLGQGSSKVYFFKMSNTRPRPGVDLVKHMQSGGSLEWAWMIFDHAKRVKDWTVLACHVYDPDFRRITTITICDMQSEDSNSQCLLWFGIV